MHISSYHRLIGVLRMYSDVFPLVSKMRFELIIGVFPTNHFVSNMVFRLDPTFPKLTILKHIKPGIRSPKALAAHRGFLTPLLGCPMSLPLICYTSAPGASSGT